MAKPAPSSLIRPTVDTPFHIDFSWWQKHDRDWRIYLHNLLCEEHRAMFSELATGEAFDWVDPETAEVRRVDGLLHVLMTHCAQEPGFLDTRGSVVDSIFRLLLAHGNAPMTPREMAVWLNRPATTLLRLLSGRRVYRGIRPAVGVPTKETPSVPQ